MNIKNHVSRIEELKHDIILLMNSQVIDSNESDITIQCATVIKNVSYLITIANTLLATLGMEKDGLMAVLQKHMEDNGIDKEESADLKINIRKNPPRLIINNEESIDKEYYYEETQTKLDKKLITEHIKKGLDVSGCKLIQDNRVDIKYKSVNSKEHV